MPKKSLFVVLSFTLIWLIPLKGFGQTVAFSADSILLVGEDVVFSFHFENNISKEDARLKINTFLDRGMDPYSGTFLKNTDDSVVCRVVDYLEIESGMFHVFGMYMTYHIKFVFHDASCDLAISQITFMEKSYFERQEETPHQFYFREYTAKEIMVDKLYRLLLKRDASEKVTDAAINRFNMIVKNMGSHFGT